MTEDLDNKLNELMGLKNNLENVSEEKMKTAIDSTVEQYSKKARLVSIFFAARYIIGIVLVVIGIIGVIHGRDVTNLNSLAILALGVFIVTVGKLCWLISESKLTILREVKESELRITEILKK